MADFGLIESFHCDNGELDGLTSAQCFTLGYEFAGLCHALANFESGQQSIVRVENMQRVEAAAAKRGRKVTWKFHEDDSSESWAEMSWETIQDTQS